MAVDKNIIIGVGVDASGVNKGMATASAAIKGATDKIQQGLKPALDGLNTSTKQATEKFSSLRQQIRNATNDAARLTEKYGATHAATKEAVKQVGLLKDKQEKLNEAIAASHPDAKFVVLKNAVQGAANAFAGIQGAMAIFGEQNKDVQAALLKVQGAMAFAQGIASIEQLGIAFKALGAVIMANPLAAVAVGIVAIGTAVAAYFGAFKSHISNQEKLNAAMKAAEKSTEKEQASLKTLLITARNEQSSKQLRLSAIKKLNEISPTYLGGLTLENINTKKADDAIKKYTNSIIDNAKAKALTTKIEEEYTKQLELNEQLLQATINEEGARRNGRAGWAAIYKTQIEGINGELKRSRDLVIDYSKVLGKLSNQSDINPFTPSNDKPTKTTNTKKKNVDTSFKAELTSRTLLIEGQLDDFQKKIEPLTAIQFKAHYDEKSFVSTQQAIMRRMDAAMKQINNAIDSAIESSLESVGTLIGDLLSSQSGAGVTFLDNILSITAGFLDTFGKALIAAAVASEAFSKLIVNPIAAAAAGIALIATAAIVRNTMKKGLSGSDGGGGGSGNNSVGKMNFAEGGIVGGAMYSGDKVQAMVNSGDMILNARLQGNLFSMIQSGISSNGGGGVLTHRISGNDLLIIMDRATKTRGRTI